MADPQQPTPEARKLATVLRERCEEWEATKPFREEVDKINAADIDRFATQRVTALPMSEDMRDRAREAIAKAISPQRWAHLNAGEESRELAEAERLLAAALTAAEAKARREATEWRSIETAPRDGAVFDVWLGDAEPADVEFYCSPGSRRSPGWAWRQGKFRPCTGLTTMTVFVQPTHWMPLPEPPAPQNTDAPPTAPGRRA